MLKDIRDSLRLCISQPGTIWKVKQVLARKDILQDIRRCDEDLKSALDNFDVRFQFPCPQDVQAPKEERAQLERTALQLVDILEDLGCHWGTGELPEDFKKCFNPQNSRLMTIVVIALTGQ